MKRLFTVKPIIKNIVLPSASLIETTNDVPNTESNKPFVPFSGKGYRLGVKNIVFNFFLI